MMDSSFFEYRDQTAVGSDSDSEIIDNSFTPSFTPKTPGKKNQTVVPESDEYTEDESEKENTPANVSKPVNRKSNLMVPHIVLSSDDDRSNRGSIRRQSNFSNNVVISSDEEETDQMSPEIIPKRPPVKPSPRSSSSFIGRKKKRIVALLDSESDNSFVKEHSRKKKCIKDSPVKIDSLRKKVIRNIQNMSIQSDIVVSDNDDDDQSDDESQYDENESQASESENDCEQNTKDKDKCHNSDNNMKNFKLVLSDNSDTSLNEVSDSDEHDHKNKDNSDDNKKQSDQSDAIEPSINEGNDIEQSDKESSRKESSLENEKDDTALSHELSSGKKSINSSDDGLEEEQMVMSRATRMSIMGVIPKDNESDDSDYIESDNTNHSSRASSIGDLRQSDIERHTVPEETTKTNNVDCSRTSLPMPSSEHNETDNSSTKNDSKVSNSNLYSPEICNLKTKMLGSVKKEAKSYKESVIDDDVTIIDKEPEIIALSSDDEFEEKSEQKSPKDKKLGSKDGFTNQLQGNTIKQYLAPPSYPNQNIVYVKKQVRENELQKLNGLREDLQNVRYLMDNMDVSTLPDHGAKLMERLNTLERDVQRQGDKVANMIVEPEMPTIEDIARDGFASASDRGLTWDDIQKASNAVQPRMFGKQAMSTHVAERNVILDRLRDLYESLASRPKENSLAKQPAGVKTELMEHQLHALAWLRWRETQRPSGGVLADDMGLGKTITMISLIVADKEGTIDDDEDDDEPINARLTRGGTLVVCPATLVQQWAAEVGKHCKSHALSVCLHHGASRATQPHRLAANDIVITTYNILQRESEKKGVLTRVRWRRVILDEAHVVRNHKSATSQGVCALPGRRRWALTGTPLHNKDLDMFALLKFLRCTPFDELTMWKKWIDNKSLGGSQRLNTIMSCVMLRRTKLQLQERGQLKCLPDRSSQEILVTLTQEEMNVYQKVLVFSKTLFAQFLHQRAQKQSGLQSVVAPNKNSEYAKMHKKMIALQGAKPVKSHEILVLLLRLRQVCCHCGLIAAMLDHDNSTELAEDAGSEDLLAELNKLTLEDNNAKRRSTGRHDDENEAEPGEGTTAAEAIKSVLSSNNPVFSLQRQSSKIKAVMECLQNNVFSKKGEKAVVVSQWTSVLGLVERELKAARIGCVTLRGDVPVTARASLITALNNPSSDVRVMLLSLCAGGVGLNLCGANHLLLLDPHWNPQLEEQAQDRIYRLGQLKLVNIYRFVCVDTVEQSIRQLQKAKLELAENVLTGAKNTGSNVSIEDLKLLFNMGPQNNS
ncbi:transcription termination factor 2 isoform X1 [Bicyclus anynana]|uniref:Transcription termination factor 2 isoform X1 n=1 Tax=Bicyclus anynana TaxID=110368 RepID=A0ABM3LYR4_BICAN|nr:transcription termination factor 2 isoform X1 [Bicyclus anynana]